MKSLLFLHSKVWLTFFGIWFQTNTFSLERNCKSLFFLCSNFRKGSKYHPKGPASCKWWTGGAGLLHMIIWRGRPLETIIRRDRPLANDHPEGLTICKWSSGCAGLLQMIIRRDGLCCSLCFPPSNTSEQNKDQNSDKRFALFNWSSFNCDWAQNAIPMPTKINVTQHLIPWPAIEWLLHLRCCNHVSNNGTVTSGSRVWNTHLWWKFSGTTCTWYLI